MVLNKIDGKAAAGPTSQSIKITESDGIMDNQLKNASKLSARGFLKHNKKPALTQKPSRESSRVGSIKNMLGSRAGCWPGGNQQQNEDVLDKLQLSDQQ